MGRRTGDDFTDEDFFEGVFAVDVFVVDFFVRVLAASCTEVVFLAVAAFVVVLEVNGEGVFVADVSDPSLFVLASAVDVATRAGGGRCSVMVIAFWVGVFCETLGVEGSSSSMMCGCALGNGSDTSDMVGGSVLGSGASIKGSSGAVCGFVYSITG